MSQSLARKRTLITRLIVSMQSAVVCGRHGNRQLVLPGAADDG